MSIDYDTSVCTAQNTHCSYRLDEKPTKSVVLNFGGGQTYGMLTGKGYQVGFVYNHLPKNWRCIPYMEGLSYKLCKNDGTIEKDGKFYY